ncbi:MAG: prepilin-type N-terminal cleavage/methylation domain-containing protein, partial [Planctomycetes bacterium]|nr:prepilin-type N-terminal cleavage/methylation domain-containing protein [Planctomycetota bacterium]
MKKGFTLIELVVAIGILAMMLGFTSIIFKVSIKGSRVVGANAEIMQKLRAVTDQLDRDIRGLDREAPLLIWFEKTSYTNDDPNNRFDQIMFFFTGDFQSTQLYDDNNGEPVDPDAEVANDEYISGNAARIYYGQAQGNSADEVEDTPSERILCRRRHIFTSDVDIEEWPDWDTDLSDFGDFNSTSGYLHNDRYEHDSLSLTEWKLVEENTFSRNVDGVVKTVFENRPEVELGVPVTYHSLLSEEAASFKIQWAYWNQDDDPDDDELRWFPCDDPDRDGISDHSHFQINGDGKFGVYFNVAGDDLDNRFGTTEWYSINNDDLIYKKSSNRSFVGDEEDFYPKALKFTFTIY